MADHMQPIALRMPPDLLERLKLIATIKGVQYQPMMREALRAEADKMVLEQLRQLAEGKVSNG